MAATGPRSTSPPRPASTSTAVSPLPPPSAPKAAAFNNDQTRLNNAPQPSDGTTVSSLLPFLPFIPSAKRAWATKVPRFS
jgi:hypothetical protein